MTETREEASQGGGTVVRFLKYTFFKVSKDWRSLGKAEKSRYSDEFLRSLKDSGPEASCFSLVGIRGDADFMILAESGSLDQFQSMTASLLSTGLGRHLDIPYSYLAMTRQTHYLGTHRHAGQEGDQRAEWSNAKFLFVYPFIKKRGWYRLPFVERQRIMAEHFKVGHKYPKI